MVCTKSALERLARGHDGEVVRGLASCSALGVHVSHAYSGVFFTSALVFGLSLGKRGGRPIVLLRPEHGLGHARMGRIRKSIVREASALSWEMPPRLVWELGQLFIYHTSGCLYYERWGEV